MKHTPKPWTWGNNYNGLFGSGKDSEVLSYASYEGMWLSFQNQEANARLIAAAPELLEALQMLLSTESGHSKQRNISIAKAECAIAKATGANNGN